MSRYNFRRKRGSDSTNFQQEEILIIILCRPDTQRSNRDHLRYYEKIFSDSNYEVIIFDPNENDESNDSLGMKKISTTADTDTGRYLDALQCASTSYPQHNVLVIRDTVMTSMSPSQIFNIISLAVRNFDNYHILYLNRNSDYCHRYRTLETIDGVRLAITTSPAGSLAILYSPTGRDMILGKTVMASGETFPQYGDIGHNLTKNIESNNIKALVTDPNVFYFNLSMAAQDSDYIQNNPCRMIEDNSQNTKTGIYGLLIFIFIVLLLLVIGIGYIFFSKKEKEI